MEMVYQKQTHTHEKRTHMNQIQIQMHRSSSWWRSSCTATAHIRTKNLKRTQLLIHRVQSLCIQEPKQKQQHQQIPPIPWKMKADVKTRQKRCTRWMVLYQMMKMNNVGAQLEYNLRCRDERERERGRTRYVCLFLLATIFRSPNIGL